MTFVAQPYEQFVSDLLTSLTGGLSREEHRFLGREETYSLTALGVRPETLRVAGEQNEAFATFELGIDYVYDGQTNALRWKPGGARPDDRSYFYVAYYTQEMPRRLTDRNPGSVTTTLAEAFSRELAVLHRQMVGIYESGFVDLASGSALDHVVALVGLTRKNARFASGEVLFKRTSPSPGDITIPSGTVVSTDAGQNFETTDRRTLRRGQLAVTAPVRAQVEGPPGKVEAEAIVSINRPIFGIDSVVNDASTFFASDKETDEELRRRARGALERAGKSTVDAIRYALIEDLSEVTDANVQVVERSETPGYVEVRLGLDTAASPDLVARVEESIFNARPAGVRVVHNLPTESPSTSARRADAITRAEALSDLEAQPDVPGLNDLPAGVLATMPDGVLRLRAEIFLRLSEANLSGAQKQNIEDATRATVTDCVEAIPMGSPIIYSKLLGRIVAPETIADAVLILGAEAGGEFHAYAGSLSSDGRKAKVDALFVGLMEERVLVDVLVRVEQKPGAAAGDGITDALRVAVTDAVNVSLAAGAESVSRQDLLAVVRNVLAARAPDLQLVADGPLVVNAEYEETGRLLNDTEQVARDEHERVMLRPEKPVTIAMQGELDG